VGVAGGNGDFQMLQPCPMRPKNTFSVQSKSAENAPRGFGQPANNIFRIRHLRQASRIYKGGNLDMLQAGVHQAADNLDLQFRGDNFFLELEAITGPDLSQGHLVWKIMFHFSRFQLK
jgi:hypothetical protein